MNDARRAYSAAQEGQNSDIGGATPTPVSVRADFKIFTQCVTFDLAFSSAFMDQRRRLGTLPGGCPQRRTEDCGNC